MWEARLLTPSFPPRALHPTQTGFNVPHARRNQRSKPGNTEKNETPRSIPTSPDLIPFFPKKTQGTRGQATAPGCGALGLHAAAAAPGSRGGRPPTRTCPGGCLPFTRAPCASLSPSLPMRADWGLGGHGGRGEGAGHPGRSAGSTELWTSNRRCRRGAATGRHDVEGSGARRGGREGP